MPHIYIRVKQIKAKFPSPHCKLKLMLRAREVQSATIGQIQLFAVPVLVVLNETIRIVYGQQLDPIRLYLLGIGQDNRVINIGSIMLDLDQGNHQIELRDPPNQSGFVSYQILKNLTANNTHIQQYRMNPQQEVQAQNQLEEQIKLQKIDERYSKDQNSSVFASNQQLTNKLSRLAASFDQIQQKNSPKFVQQKNNQFEIIEMDHSNKNQAEDLKKILQELKLHQIKNQQYREIILINDKIIDQSRNKIKIFKQYWKLQEKINQKLLIRNKNY